MSTRALKVLRILALVGAIGLGFFMAVSPVFIGLALVSFFVFLVANVLVERRTGRLAKRAAMFGMNPGDKK